MGVWWVVWFGRAQCYPAQRVEVPRPVEAAARRYVMAYSQCVQPTLAVLAGGAPCGPGPGAITLGVVSGVTGRRKAGGERTTLISTVITAVTVLVTLGTAASTRRNRRVTNVVAAAPDAAQ